MLLRPRHSLLATGLAAFGLVGLAAPGLAATRVLPKDIEALPRGATIEYGEATLALKSSASSKLKRAGVKLSASGGDAEVKGSKIVLQAQEQGTLVDPIAMRGSIALQGGVVVKGRQGSVKVTAITLQPGKAANVTAKVGSKKVTLGSLTGGKAKFVAYADASLTGATLKLSAGGARALSKATGSGFAAGGFATVAVKITARQYPLISGSARATLTPTFLKLLADNGLTLGVAAPATLAGNVVTMVLTGGAFDPEGLTGRLAFDGTVTISRADRTISLFGWRAVIGAKQNELFAQIDKAVAAPIGSMDVSDMAVSLDGTQFNATGATLRMSKIAVASIKTSFGVSVPENTPFATVDMTGVTPAGG